MSLVQVTYAWPTGEEVAVSVQIDEGYPDSVDEARTQAMNGFREAVALLLDIKTD